MDFQSYSRECPNCFRESMVISSQIKEDGSIKRRRRCPECEKRWNTYEISEEAYQKYLHIMNTSSEEEIKKNYIKKSDLVNAMNKLLK